MNYAMLIKYIQKPWIDTKGIMEVAQCGRHSATKIRNEIEKRIYDTRSCRSGRDCSDRGGSHEIRKQ